MRRLLALGCCLAYLAFGVVAGAAHVHGAADHHEEMRGLHLDHAHVGGAPDLPAHHHEPSPPGDGETRIDVRHARHHEGDALYLDVAARRSLDAGLRVLPARVAAGVSVDPPKPGSLCCDLRTDRPGEPPRQGPSPSRAPPA